MNKGGDMALEAAVAEADMLSETAGRSTSADDRIQQTLASSPAIIHSCIIDPNAPVEEAFRPYFISDNITRLLGYRMDEVIDDCHWWQEHMHPDDADSVMAHMRELLEQGRSVLEYRFRHKNGTYLWVHHEMVLVCDNTGTPIAVSGAWVDVTEQKLIDQAYQASEVQYRLHIENIREVVYSFDSRLRLTYVSPAVEAFVGYKPSELIGRSLHEFRPLTFESARRTFRQIPRILRGGHVHSMTATFIARDGSQRIGEGSASPYIVNGKVCGIVGVIRDVTELHSANDAATRLLAENRRLSGALLSAQEEERQRLARELHDELGQSLTAIDTLATMIVAHAERTETAANARAISDIIADLYGLVRNILSRLNLHMLDTLGLQASLEDLVNRSPQTGCVLQVTGEIDNLPGAVNVALFRIVQESLTNALKYADADSVEVHLQHLPEQVRLDIRDHGRGMEVEQIGSHGLGLIGIRERVAALGGQCCFESAPGAGMHVSVTIPLIIEEAGR